MILELLTQTTHSLLWKKMCLMKYDYKNWCKNNKYISFPCIDILIVISKKKKLKKVLIPIYKRKINKTDNNWYVLCTKDNLPTYIVQNLKQTIQSIKYVD